MTTLVGPLPTKTEESVLALAARGYTIRRIKSILGLKVDDDVLINLIGDRTFDEERAKLDAITLQRFGLASTLERVRRLAELAEGLEAIIALGEVSLIPEYRRILTAIRDELKPFNLSVTVGDPWANLLRDVANAGLEQSNTSTTVDSY